MNNYFPHFNQDGIAYPWLFVLVDLSLKCVIARWRLESPPSRLLLNHLLRRGSKKTSKIRATGLYEGKSPMAGEFPLQRTTNAEAASIWWRHYAVSMNEISPYRFSDTQRAMFTTQFIGLSGNLITFCWLDDLYHISVTHTCVCVKNHHWCRLFGAEPLIESNIHYRQFDPKGQHA